MKVHIVGGGPAGLFLGILLKKADPAHQIVVFERNLRGETFGWGVVFSAQTLGAIAAADPEVYAAIEAEFIAWDAIDIFWKGARVRSAGHGFCGLSRVKLLGILQDRALALGCEVQNGVEVEDPEALGEADLVVAADGVNSALRTRYADTFQPTLDWRSCRFTWLGSTLKLSAFTFFFAETDWGLFQVHAYPFDATASTFIVECQDDTWKRAGLQDADDAATVAFCERIFAAELEGARLLANNSIWRRFPTVRAQRWVRGNLVLLGDAAHTAHFSIGSGTKLAMEDAIALAAAFAGNPGQDVPAVLSAYEAARRPEVERLQHAAQTSLEWFENSSRYRDFHPIPFAFSLLTRSKRITLDELGRRDPALAKQVTSFYATSQGARPQTAPIFTPYTLRGLTLSNRIVVSPMCQYSATDGMPDDWHLVHLGSRAVGGAGLLICEATGISPEGRITPGCTGIWNDAHVPAWRRIVDFAHRHGSGKIGLQIGHAGRKGACRVPWEGGTPLVEGAWPLIAPSVGAWDAGSQPPKAMDAADMDAVVADFVAAARRAEAAGFDLLELHFAHGYLLSTFLSPLTNRRIDAWGGDVHRRLRLPVDILDAVRTVWPEEKPISVRISATEWAPGGLDDAQRIVIAQTLRAHGADIIDCSAGGVVPDAKPIYGRMFQVPFSDQIRNEARVPTMAVGAITEADQCNTLLAAGRADLIVLARQHLRDPYFTMHAAEQYGHEAQPWPKQYLAVAPRHRKG